MKMMCFLMFVLLVQVRGDVVAQNQVVSVDMKNCSVEEFLREIKEQTGIRFMYKSEYVEACTGRRSRSDGFVGRSFCR